MAWLALWSACSPAQPPQPPGPVPLGRVSERSLTEISGAAASRQHPGILWVHNDGQDGRLFALRTNGPVLAVYRLPEAVRDVEDLALGPGPDRRQDYLYVGDIGDNGRNRGSIQVLRLPEPALLSGGVGSARRPTSQPRPEVFVLQYPDGPHDAEALLVDPTTGDVLVVTKESRRARVYTAKQDQLRGRAPVQLRFVLEIPCAQVSAGDISRDGRWILLRREDAAWLWSREAAEPVGSALSRPPRPAPVVGPPGEPNGEAVAWNPQATGYYTVSEGKLPFIHLLPAPWL